MSKEQKALLLGASGLVGSQLLHRLIANPEYSALHVISRRSLNGGKNSSKKLRELVLDFDRLGESPAEDFKVDHVFSCLGTTRAKTASEDLYRKIEIDYPIKAAELAIEQGTTSFHYVSSMGASKTSPFSYSKIKGEAEDKLCQLQKQHPKFAVYIYRPSFIDGTRTESRPAEKMLLPVFRALKPLMFGSFKRYAAIHANVIAQAIEKNASNTKPGFWILESDEIAEKASN